MSISSLVVATRAAMETHTVNVTSCVREGHHSVPGAVVRSSADVFLQCHGDTMSSTSSVHSVVSHCFVVLSESSTVDLIAVHVSHDWEDSDKSNRNLVDKFFCHTGFHSR